MRGRTAVLGLALAVGVGTVVHTDLVSAPAAVFAPAYDAVTQASLRNLATALQSYALLEGDLDAVTTAELADWGWEPHGTSAVTLWVDGTDFLVVAEDVRPGGTAFQLEGGEQGITAAHRLSRDLAALTGAGVDPGVLIVRGLPAVATGRGTDQA
ncbi:hypothetical protein J4G33_15445 [Actinotalea sp. BY-33]|uniref:Uncharacterized protein n=1 Tax=Actinotalea soli TaxID=2819234 RepID=A0A939LRH3_9CELL|nr:hypothetical protein [Actinotalea soli]MBO1753201.1 hypothetical protein [Actinotalea soli]